MNQRFELLSEIRAAETIASGRGVIIRDWLKQTFGGSNWRKMKGIALVRDRNNNVYEAEIHWFECHGVGKKLFKIKE